MDAEGAAQTAAEKAIRQRADREFLIVVMTNPLRFMRALPEKLRRVEGRKVDKGVKPKGAIDMRRLDLLRRIAAHLLQLCHGAACGGDWRNVSACTFRRQLFGERA